MTGSLDISPTDDSVKYIRVKRNLDADDVRSEICVGSNRTANIGLIKNGSYKNRLVLSDVDSTLEKPLTISSGGTGANSKKEALKNLGITLGSNMAGIEFNVYSAGNGTITLKTNSNLTYDVVLGYASNNSLYLAKVDK